MNTTRKYFIVTVLLLSSSVFTSSVFALPENPVPQDMDPECAVLMVKLERLETATAAAAGALAHDLFNKELFDIYTALFRKRNDLYEEMEAMGCF